MAKQPNEPAEQQTPPAPQPTQCGEAPPAPTAPADPPADEPHADTPRHQSFWQRRSVQNALPLATSVILHVGILVVGYLTYDVIVQAVAAQREQIIIPDATMIERADEGGIPNPGLGEDPTREIAQLEVDEPAQSWATRPSETFTDSLMADRGGEAASIIGVGPSQPGSGPGDITGAGETGSAGLAPFGMPGGGGGIGPRADLMGASGNATKVIYICDATGSMLGIQWDLLQNELRKAIDMLRPIQAYNVIFYKSPGYESVAGGLQMANPANKRRTYDTLEQIRPAGPQVDPLRALETAFSQQPELIYLLSDGIFDSNRAVIDLIERRNADRRVTINTIGYFPDDIPESEKRLAVEALRTIAEQNGGRFTLVQVSDLIR